MKLSALTEQFRHRPFFETRQVVAMFEEPEPQIQARLSRWVAAGQLLRLRRGKYLLPASIRRAEVSVYHISNYLLRPSYVSLHSALEYHALIPEAVAAVQALTPKHGNRWDTPVGTFRYKSIAQRRFFGYRAYSPRPPGSGRSPRLEVAQQAFLIARPEAAQQSFLMARPEKAVLDLFYAVAGEWDTERIAGMRFQNLDGIDGDRLLEYAQRFSSPKVTRAGSRFLRLHEAELAGGVA